MRTLTLANTHTLTSNSYFSLPFFYPFLYRFFFTPFVLFIPLSFLSRQLTLSVSCFLSFFSTYIYHSLSFTLTCLTLCLSQHFIFLPVFLSFFIISLFSFFFSIGYLVIHVYCHSPSFQLLAQLIIFFGQIQLWSNFQVKQIVHLFFIYVCLSFFLAHS